MSKKPDFFAGDAALSYDERNRKLFPIANCLHFLTALTMTGLPADAHILCVGAGTGAEIMTLAERYPSWTFVALDPSASMLEVCRLRLEHAGFLERCTLLCGYVEDLPEGQSFDAALSILVAHFVEAQARLSFFQGMIHRLKRGGLLINAEISFDLSSENLPSMTQRWAEVQKLMGATPESLANLPMVLTDVLTVLAPEQSEALMRQGGITHPIRFFQAFMICGWYGIKEE